MFTFVKNFLILAVTLAAGLWFTFAGSVGAGIFISQEFNLPIEYSFLIIAAMLILSVFVFLRPALAEVIERWSDEVRIDRSNKTYAESQAMQRQNDAEEEAEVEAPKELEPKYSFS